MASVVEEAVQPPIGGLPESRVLLSGVSWAMFREIAKTRRGRSVPRLSFLQGRLELMSPGLKHEGLAQRFDYFVVMLVAGLNRPWLPTGSTLWERAGLERGKEPDVSFYLANAPAVVDLEEIDLEIHPPPDLAIEIELSRPTLDVLQIDSGLGVPEVWQFDAKGLHFHHLGQDGIYAEREYSLNFPTLRSSEALGWIQKALRNQDLNLWLEQVKNWARQDLAARGVAPQS